MGSPLHLDLINLIGEFLGDCRYKLVFHETPKRRLLSQQIAVVPRKNVDPLILHTFPKLRRKTIYRYTNRAAKIFFIPDNKCFVRIPCGRNQRCGKLIAPHEFTYYYLKGAYPY
jgi:hypothetical protein